MYSESKKQNKTENMETYYKEYREKNAQHLKNRDRVRFYKMKYGMPEDFVTKYGDYSADVFKLILDYNKIKEKNEELAKTILTEFI